MSIASFDYGQSHSHSRTENKKSFKDREGVDFEPQILSQRRFHTKFQTEKEVSGNEKFDIRRYYPRNHIRELHLDDVESVARDINRIEFKNEGGNGQDGGYKSYRGGRRGGRGGRHEPREQKEFIPKEMLNSSEVYLESCNMANYMILAITKDELLQEIGRVFGEADKKTLQGKITDYYKGRIDEGAFFKEWVDLLGKRLAYQVFPFFIATCENEVTCKVLDDFFYNQMLRLPRKNEALIHEFSTYNDFFKRLYQEIEQNVLTRINEKKINFKEKNYMMDTHRILQLIQIIKRLSNADMASFKFAINFGLVPKTKEDITDILLHQKDQIQQKLSQISEQEIFILLKYLELCKVKLSKAIENISFSKISANLLEAIFQSSADIYLLFEKELGKEEFKKLTEKKYVELEARPGQQGPTMTSNLSKNAFEERKIEQERFKKPGVSRPVEVQNKHEFPNLEKTISGVDTLPVPPSNLKKQGQKIIGNSGWEKTTNPYGSKTADVKKDVELRKKVEEDFPSLAGDANVTEQANYWSKLNKPIKKKEVKTNNEWEKNGNEEFVTEDDVLDDMVIGVSEKKGKKNKAKKTTYLTGGFR